MPSELQAEIFERGLDIRHCRPPLTCVLLSTSRFRVFTRPGWLINCRRQPLDLLPDHYFRAPRAFLRAAILIPGERRISGGCGSGQDRNHGRAGPPWKFYQVALSMEPKVRNRSPSPHPLPKWAQMGERATDLTFSPNGRPFGERARVRGRWRKAGRTRELMIAV
jgi:hypothetical protein